jgi:hypothetical protein
MDKWTERQGLKTKNTKFWAFDPEVSGVARDKKKLQK